MKRGIFALIIICYTICVEGQIAIEGIINNYASVSSINYCSNSIEVDNGTLFTVGEQVLIYQAQGAQIRDNNNSNFGTVTDLGAAGKYEINQIEQIVGNTLVLSFSFINNDYNPSNSGLQLVSVPVYGDVTVASTLTAQEWDGAKGGVLALMVDGNLTLEAPINVSGKGFRGGVSQIDEENNCNFFPRNGYTYGLNDWRGSTKGEGISAIIPGKEAGRGPQANGGGGGNDHNSGGGGGANQNMGGDGSPSIAGCNGQNPGIGGLAVSASGRLFLGGGGGAGHENNNLMTDGGNGGGLVFIIARDISTNGFSIIANGDTPNTVSGDGAGGGGAGGTMVIDVENINGTLNLMADGGDGGDQNSFNRNSCMGVGGGGSGGVIYKAGAIGSVESILGGHPGQNLECANGSLFGEAGADGRVINNYSLVKSTTLFERLEVIAPETIEVCNEEIARIEASIKGSVSNYQWQINQGQGFVDLLDDSNHSGTQAPILEIQNADSASRYRLIVESNCGETKSSAPIRLQTQVDPLARFDAEINERTVILDNRSTSSNRFSWDFGDGDTSTETEPTHTYDQPGIYTITLTAENDCGNNIVTKVVEIVPDLVAGFSLDQNVGCVPFEVQFTNESSQGSNIVFWSFPGGTPNQSNSENPTVMYNAPGVYTAILIVTNGEKNDTLNMESLITVNEEPELDFEISSDGLVVTLQNNSNNVSEYSWSFGDGATSSEENPIHTYRFGGDFMISLIGKNECGSKTIEKSLSLRVPLSAEVGVDQEGNCAPIEVRFSDLSTGTVFERSWLFPGGQPSQSSDLNPSVVYNQAGNYNVTLIIKNDIESDTLEIPNLQVNDVPSADFQFSVDELEVTFVNESVRAESQVWQFGEGTTSIEESPFYSFPEDTTYLVTLISSNVCGEDTISREISLTESPVADFGFSVLDACIPGRVTFNDQSSGTITNREWLFVGGTPNTSTEPRPTVVYATPGIYQARLIVGNELVTDTMEVGQIQIQPSVNAEFECITSNLTASISNLSEHADAFFWQFDNAGNSSAFAPSFTFESAGTYNIQLIASNECSVDTISKVVVVFERPMAGFSSDFTEGCEPFEVRFQDESAGSVQNRIWEFEGGIPSTSTSANPVVRYETPGVYSVRLKVSNEESQDSSLIEDYIQVSPQSVADYNWGANELRVDFSNASFGANTYFWDFGDGNSSMEESPRHIYSQDGQYSVLLIAQNSCSIDSFERVVEVYQSLRPIFTQNKMGGCAPTNIQFLDQSVGTATNWSWEFPGGNPSRSSEPNPIVVYNTPGKYAVNLTISNERESQTILMNDAVSIVLSPVPEFDYTIIDNEIRFTNLSEGAVVYAWNFGDGNQSTAFEPTHTYLQDGMYTVTLNAQNEFCGQASSQQIMIVLTNFDDEQSLQFIRMYPNPAKSLVQIEHNLRHDFDMKLFDLQGSMVMRRRISEPSNAIMVGHLPPAQYVVQFWYQDQVWEQFLIVK